MDRISEPINEENVLIVGTGALACLFAARLVAAGVSVAMLGSWQDGLRVLSEQGVTLYTANGERHRYPVLATADPNRVPGARHAIVLVKAWQTERAALQLQACLASEAVALTLQNGWGNYEILCEHLGVERVALGVTTVGATLLAPGEVRQAGEGSIALGEHPRLGRLAAYLQKAGFELELSSNPNRLLWGKLVINAAINPLTALLGVPNGELLRRPAARELMRRAAIEAAAVAQAHGIELPFPDASQMAERVAQQTAENLSSMLQDVRRGAPTEIDAICGALVRLAQQVEVPTPTLEMFWLLVQARVQQPKL